MNRRAFLKTSAALAAVPAAFSAAPAQTVAQAGGVVPPMTSEFAKLLGANLEKMLAEIYAAQYQHVQYGYSIIMKRDHVRVERI